MKKSASTGFILTATFAQQDSCSTQFTGPGACRNGSLHTSPAQHNHLSRNPMSAKLMRPMLLDLSIKDGISDDLSGQQTRLRRIALSVIRLCTPVSRPLNGNGESPVKTAQHGISRSTLLQVTVLMVRQWVCRQPSLQKTPPAFSRGFIFALCPIFAG